MICEADAYTESGEASRGNKRRCTGQKKTKHHAREDSTTMIWDQISSSSSSSSSSADDAENTKEMEVATTIESDPFLDDSAWTIDVDMENTLASTLQSPITNDLFSRPQPQAHLTSVPIARDLTGARLLINQYLRLYPERSPTSLHRLAADLEAFITSLFGHPSTSTILAAAEDHLFVVAPHLRSGSLSERKAPVYGPAMAAQGHADILTCLALAHASLSETAASAAADLLRVVANEDEKMAAHVWRQSRKLSSSSSPTDEIQELERPYYDARNVFPRRRCPDPRILDDALLACQILEVLSFDRPFFAAVFAAAERVFGRDDFAPVWLACEERNLGGGPGGDEVQLWASAIGLLVRAHWMLVANSDVGNAAVLEGVLGASPVDQGVLGISSVDDGGRTGSAGLGLRMEAIQTLDGSWAHAFVSDRARWEAMAEERMMRERKYD